MTSESQTATSEENALRAQLAELMRTATAARSGDDAYWAIANGKSAQPSAPAAPAAAPTAVADPTTNWETETEPRTVHRRFRDDELAAAAAQPTAPFVPAEPTSLRAAGLTESEVEALILKCLLNCGDVAGRAIAEQLHLPFRIVQQLLAQLKLERLVVYRGDAGLNDYQYQLTDAGADRAKRFAQHCTYFGAAPVALEDYIQSVHAQTLTVKKPSRSDLERAFTDLVLSTDMFSQLGQALHAGKGLFLYGSPGNGKTAIAQRVTAAYGEMIWIPRCISVHGEIVRLFDPTCHQEAPPPSPPGIFQNVPVDQRWVRIRRPTIVVGGELTMESLEIKTNRQTGIGEAPLQMKSNCGTLVIDDFGRQRISTDELLNRWIVPLETGYDFLSVASGRKVQVPFDQLIVFSTNLEPADLVDEAFLRRIPYKLEVLDPSEAQFRAIFMSLSAKMKLACSGEVIDYLIEKHYKG
ncbi:MAG: AAA family ATPase, partial [Planctomycetales bacterium]|nr:AAA family ATPase [Planctomycetales bacterium]